MDTVAVGSRVGLQTPATHLVPGPHPSSGQRGRQRSGLGLVPPPQSATAPASSAPTHDAPGKPSQLAPVSQLRVQVPQKHAKLPQSASEWQALSQLVCEPIVGSSGPQPATKTTSSTLAM